MNQDFVKITNAIYRMLDWIPEGDPLRNRAKEKVLAILDGVSILRPHGGWIPLKNYLSKEDELLAQTILRDIGLLENYLIVARDQGWIGHMNFMIAMKEYTALKESLRGSAKQVTLVASPEFAQTQQKPAGLKDVVAKKKQKPQETEENITPRQVKILQLLQKRKKAQVADLFREMPNITKRTIRRDLDGLLKEGKIQRIGEWNQVFYQIKDRT